MPLDLILSKGTPLYRYDLEKPPIDWDPSYKNLEYRDINIDGHSKNEGSLNFFFTDEQSTILTANQALKKFPAYKGFYLTKTQLVKDLRLLDITGCKSALLMFQKLIVSQIDVFNEKYLLYDGVKSNFSILRDPVYYNLALNCNPIDREVEKIEENSKYIRESIEKYEQFGYYPFTLLGQLLTDYSNGVHFKQALQNKGFEGYSFDETIGAHTVCLFDTEVLTPPKAIFHSKEENL